MASLKYYTDTMVEGGNRHDYSKLLSNAMLDGKSADYVKSLYDSRLNMINSDSNLEQYRDDDIMRQAQEYIKNNSETDKTLDQMKNVYVGKDSMYANALKESAGITDASVKKAVGELEAQKESTNQSYSDLFRQLYQNKMNSEKNIDQQLAQQGITGGMSETTRLGIDSKYADALRKGEQERVKGISEIDRAITDVKLDGDIQKAQAAVDMGMAAANGYASYLQTALNQANNDAAIEREQNYNNRSYASNQAWTLIQNGIMPSAGVLASAGISQADAQAYIDSYNAAKNESATANDRNYAYSYVTSMLQNGIMPSAEALATAGISQADAQAYIDSYNAAKNESATANDRNYAYSYVTSMLQNGIMPSAEALATAGISQADAQAYVDKVTKDQNAARYSSTTPTYSTTPQLSYSAALDMAKNGILTDNVVSSLMAAGYTSEDIYRRFFDYEGVREGIIANGLVQDDYFIPMDSFEALQIAYPTLTEETLNNMGFVLEPYYSDPSKMGPKARKIYSDYKNKPEHFMPGLTSMLNRALSTGEISQVEYNTILRALGKD